MTGRGRAGGEGRGELVELTIAGLAAGGDGVGRDAAGRVTFVPWTAPGDRVRARVVEAHRSYARADLVEVGAPSPDRIVAPCPYAAARTCGGCPWMHVRLDAQRAAKQALAASALRAHVAAGLALAPIATPAPPLGWRRRMRMHGRAGRRGLALGYFAPRSRDLVDIARCPQLDPQLDRAAQAARALGPHLDGRFDGPWRVEGGGDPAGSAGGAGGRAPRGFDLHGVVGHAGDVHLAIELEHPLPRARLDALVAAARALVDGEAAPAVGISVEVRGAPDRRVVAGAPDVELEPGLRAGAADFAQASAAGNAALVAAVVAAVAPRPGLRVLELYAGAGNFTRALVAAGADVVMNDLRASAAPPARFEAGRAEDVVARLAAAGARFDAVLLDPPRTGAREAAAALADLAARGAAPARVVYVSCDAATCARDLAILAAAGWTPRTAQVLDLMPQTAHLELVVVAERRVRS